MHIGRRSLVARKQGAVNTKEETAVEFEKLFARQLVLEMTKGLFSDAAGSGMPMSSGRAMYREQIIDTLAGELAKQQGLGMADMVRRVWDEQINGFSGESTNSKRGIQ